MTRKCHVRFGGGPLEKGWRQHLAGGLPYFQAAVAALIREGIRPHGDWGHDFVQGRFVGQLVDRRKRFRGDLRRTLPVNQDLRDQGDYQGKHVTQTQAYRALGRAREFVSAVEEWKAKGHV